MRKGHPRCCGLASIEGVSVAVCPGVGRLQQYNSNSIECVHELDRFDDLSIP